MKYLPVIVVLIVGILLAFLSSTIMKGYEAERIKLELKRSAEERHLAVQRGLEATYLVLESMAAFDDSTVTMGRQNFKRFVQPLLQNNTVIQALEWIPLVPLSERVAYEQKAHQDGYPQFSITERKVQGQMVPAGERDEYYPVYYVEPYQGNEIALGFDLASNPARKQALKSCRQNGKMAATARITLVQEKATQYGFLLFFPVYQVRPEAGQEPFSPKLEGYMLGVFRIGDLVKKAIGYLDPKDIDIVLEDMSAPEKERLLYFSGAQHSGTGQEQINESLERSAEFSEPIMFDVADREWRMTFIAGPGFIAAQKTNMPLIFFFGGLLGTTLFAAYLFTAIRSKSQLKQASELLQSQINARSHAEQALDKSQILLLHAQKMEAIGTLAAGIAHELNTPIQYLTSNTDFLAEAFTSLSKAILSFQNTQEHVEQPTQSLTHIETAQEILDDADWDYLKEEIPSSIQQSREGLHRVTSIIRAMKEFSHPGSKVKEEADLAHIIENTVLVARNEWKYVADVVTDFDKNLPLVLCMRDEIGQVILNLLINATHAIKEKIGGNPENRKGVITIKTKNCDGWAEIDISDTGTGIPEDIRHRIFDPFYTTKEVGRGSGQGLAIVHDVITVKHGGTIGIESIMGQGATFIICLPVTDRG
ncbi:MAG: CHASE domain-containing protein [Desulfocapsaceae bacterium]|nr:CHASE domain-containing protein [Desulfocapsaceae bacterium]